ncbi:MAG: lysophospholipase [Sphaerochaetaceae bacterium]|nr:lysophospholipase [Sphaerochaetaceae bacterium]
MAAGTTGKNYFVCSDGHKMAYNLWLPSSGKPKAFIQILHGMAEHSDRYARFAKFLNKNGYAVFAGDHRGHGDSIEDGLKGYFTEKDGWDRIAEDASELAAFVTSQHAASTTFLFGHSMGSFLARTVMVNNPQFYTGVVIMGTSASMGLVGKVGKLVCKSQISGKGPKEKGVLMDKLSFGSYNNAFKPVRTDFDWLSRDPREVDKYVADDLCGFVCTNAFYLDLLTGIETANNVRRAKSLPSDLPLLIISGEADPVGANGKGVRKVYDLYKKAGISDVTLKLYPEARHELLNETNRSEVEEYILSWFEAHL